MLPQSIIEGDLTAAVGLKRINCTLPDRNAQHLLQAECLGAKLNVIMEALSARPVLVFHRNDAPIGVELHNIPFALQPQPIRPEWQGTFDAYTIFHCGMRLIYPLVGMPTTQSKNIFIEDALHMDESALARAVRKMFQCRDKNGLFVFHVLVLATPGATLM